MKMLVVYSYEPPLNSCRITSQMTDTSITGALGREGELLDVIMKMYPHVLMAFESKDKF
jgi:hypothetical protein